MSKENIIRKNIGELPILSIMAHRLEFEQILSQSIKPDIRDKINPSKILMQIIYNITSSRYPLYELSQWILKNDLRMFDMENYDTELNDDRFARALYKLYTVDRASLMTQIVLQTTKSMDINFDQIHNDSTSIKAFGKISGVTQNGLELKKGVSKDHRPDLKQLVFSLTISADGAVPIHYKTYSGNRTDDTTHIDTWNTVRSIAGKSNFLYVADCKVCTDKQLSYITDNGGRVVTIAPETWGEVTQFKDDLRSGIIKNKKRVLKKIHSQGESKYSVYSHIIGKFRTVKRGYSLFWTHSSEKKRQDAFQREVRIQNADKALIILSEKINKGKYVEYSAIEGGINDLCKKYKVTRFLSVEVIEEQFEVEYQIGKGRPGPKTKYKTVEEKKYSLTWKWYQVLLRQEKKVDGIFPLLCTDEKMSAKEALEAYKYQPRLEKRFTQLKSIHNAAPLLFKKIERVEAMMFLFFLALILQSVIEREIREQMKKKSIDALPIYPEHRLAYHPTTAKVIDTFEGVSVYFLENGGKRLKEFRDSLSDTQRQILNLLDIPESIFWDTNK
ncbi:MAG: IS1634 family transposase [Flavobacteriaceae bacterium]|nr:IS1634 family transposase [Flavobacteriaceae bacterium]